MHEMSVAESMLDLIADALGGRAEIESVSLTLGPLAGINAASLKFCFTEVARQLSFGSPKLLINHVPANAECGDCYQPYDLYKPHDLCPYCNSMARSVTGGDDFTIDTVDVMETIR